MCSEYVCAHVCVCSVSCSVSHVRRIALWWIRFNCQKHAYQIFAFQVSVMCVCRVQCVRLSHFNQIIRIRYSDQPSYSIKFKETVREWEKKSNVEVQGATSYNRSIGEELSLCTAQIHSQSILPFHFNWILRHSISSIHGSEYAAQKTFCYLCESEWEHREKNEFKQSCRKHSKVQIYKQHLSRAYLTNRKMDSVVLLLRVFICFDHIISFA